MKRTRYQRLAEERRTEKRKSYRKTPIKITQQPTMKRDCYAGRCTWQWTSGPERGTKYNQPVVLPYAFQLKLRGKDLIVQPSEGEEFVWGEGQSEEAKRKQAGEDAGPLPTDAADRVQTMLAMLRAKLEALIEEKGPRGAGKTMARAFILAHNKLDAKVAKRALAKLYAAVLTDSNRAAFLSFGAHIRRSASMTKKTTASARLSAKIIVSGYEFGDNTLEQLVGMAVESMLEGEAQYLLSDLISGGSLSSAVKSAASAYEAAAEALLTEIGGDEAAEEVMNNEGPFLMFMTQEGHGVGIHDGDLDNVEGIDVDVLDKQLDKHPGITKAYMTLKTAIEENAWELVSEAMEDLVDEANSAVAEKLDEYEEHEIDPDGSTAGEVAGFLGDQITYTHTSLKDFSEDNRDSNNDDLAEAVADAFAAGHDERDIFEAIQDVGEIEYIDSIRATRGFSLSNAGEVELMVRAGEIEVNNPYGRGKTNVATIVEVLEELSDVDAKFDYEMGSDGDITESRELDGYWNWDVDPAKLRRKLRLK